jgi:hypothetical protein
MRYKERTTEHLPLGCGEAYDDTGIESEMARKGILASQTVMNNTAAFLDFVTRMI